jgi:hypothetical protein
MALIRSGVEVIPPPPGMMICPDCKATISQKANACPKCGRAMKSLGMTVLKVVLWFMAITFAIGVVVGVFSALFR